MEASEPAGLLIGVFGAEAAGHETRDRVELDHYTFDHRALVQPGLTHAKGELWVATQGGYVTRYTLTARGGPTYFGKDTEGTVSWDYALTDINEPVAIELPDDCPAGMVDAPLLADASKIVKAPALVAYQTASSVTDAAAFYREQMPGKGWKLDGEPSIEAARAMLNFAMRGETMTILATATQPGTRVRILVSRPPAVSGVR